VTGTVSQYRFYNSTLGRNRPLFNDLISRWKWRLWLNLQSHVTSAHTFGKFLLSVMPAGVPSFITSKLHTGLFLLP
jgi:hypothetical protein